MIQFLKNSFAGREKLYRVWWFWGLPMFVAFYAGSRIVIHRWLWESTSILYSFFSVTLVMLIFWWICAWRCAPNVQNRVWLYAARGIIVLQVLLYSNRIRMMFF
ncbi:MAG: hypothetical protein JXA79_08460 [Deltaproteobacteria bacterium]|nr:hypothetical protein [Deltaproteobacteria bacterium]